MDENSVFVLVAGEYLEERITDSNIYRALQNLLLKSDLKNVDGIIDSMQEYGKAARIVISGASKGADHFYVLPAFKGKIPDYLEDNKRLELVQHDTKASEGNIRTYHSSLLELLAKEHGVDEEEFQKEISKLSDEYFGQSKEILSHFIEKNEPQDIRYQISLLINSLENKGYTPKNTNIVIGGVEFDDCVMQTYNGLTGQGYTAKINLDATDFFIKSAFQNMDDIMIRTELLSSKGIRITSRVLDIYMSENR